MSKKEDNPFNEIFVQNFIGQEVELLINLYHRSEVGDENGVQIEQAPLAVRGFILDVDDNYIYLGETSEFITKFVKKDLVAGGDIVLDSEDGLEEMLNNLPTNGSAN